MKFERTELDKQLKTLSPALYTKEGVDELSCIWFDGTDATTYDGELGIVTRIASEVKGGINGSVLLRLVGLGSAKQIEVLKEGENVLLKAGRSRQELPLLPIKRQPRWPESLQDCKSVPITSELLDALKEGCVAVGVNESRPDFLGTTLMVVGEELQLFNSDGATATASFCPIPKGWAVDRVAWPRRFCDQLIKMFDRDDGELWMTPGSVLATREDKTWLLGRELVIEQPVNYGNMFARIVPESFEKRCYPIPESFKASLDQALVLLTRQKESRIKIEARSKKQLILSGGGDAGQFTDELAIDGEQDPVAIRTDPMLLRRILPHVNTMLLTDTAAIFGKEENDFTHVISCNQAV